MTKIPGVAESVDATTESKNYQQSAEQYKKMGLDKHFSNSVTNNKPCG